MTFKPEFSDYDISCIQNADHGDSAPRHEIGEEIKRCYKEIERLNAIIARQRDMFAESSENEEIRLRKENERLNGLVERAKDIVEAFYNGESFFDEKCQKWLKDAESGV